ncbi:MAG TPA: SH3 domain-containing protein [Polyangia bacterium]
MLRERPTSSARILDRLAAGKKVPMLGRTDDGNWVHVRADGHEGWIQAAAVKGLRSEDDEASADSGDEEEAKPLAKRRGVRPEAWVSKSRYHEGEELKLIVSVNEANLYGRPSATGAVLGILRRGEQVQLVKKSADQKWINIDIGGGETAWIQAKAVKPGRVAGSTPPPDESAQEEAAPPPTITPEGAKKKAKLAKAEEQQQQEEAPPPPPRRQAKAEPPPEEEPPPPPPKKGKKQAKVEAPPPEEEPPPPKKHRDTEDETPPGLAPSKGGSEATTEEEKPKKKRKLKKLASRSDEESSTEGASTTIVKDTWTTRGKVYLSPGVRAGIGILSQRFTSNGMTTPGNLANYESSTNAFGAQIGLGVYGTVGKYLLFGGDASYTFVGAAAVKYTFPDAMGVKALAVQAHTIDGGVSAGVHFNVLGGFSVRLRLGGQMVLNLVQPDVNLKLPSDRILGMTIGLGLAAPALFTLAGHPFGVQLFGGGLVPAQRAQTVGLEDGAQSTTFGAFFGGGLSFILMQPHAERYKGSLAAELAYSYEFVATHYTGLSRRNNSISVADRGSAQHLIGLGLGYYF